MSKTAKVLRSVADLSLAAMLALAIVMQVAKAETPANDAENAKASPGAAALRKAAKDNKYLFIFFWKENTEHSRAMRGVFQAAVAKMTDKAEPVEIQLEDEAEKTIVTQYGVSRSPMPLVLAIAPNGAITKGLPTQFDENQLQQAFVSPGTAECMKALQENKLVLLCVEPQSAKVKTVSLQKGVEAFKADKEYTDSTKVIVLKASDPAEASFLKDLKVDPKTTSRITVLIAPPAAVIGTLTGEVTKDQLVAALKAAQSGCCPGGKCGPGGCCGKK
jgi:hypothetical protein